MNNLRNKKIRTKLLTLLKHITICNYNSIDIASLFTYIDDYIEKYCENQNVDEETLNSIKNTTTICYKTQWQGMIKKYYNNFTFIKYITKFSN